MTFTYLAALVLIAASLSILMAGAWVVQQRTGNSGWVDTIWTFSLGLVGAISALWPIAGPPNARQMAGGGACSDLVAAARHSYCDPHRGHYRRSALRVFRKRNGASMRRGACSSSCRNQALGTIPLAFAIFVAARHPSDVLRLQDYAGVLILLIGIAGEALSDAQLKAFRENPVNKGRVCDVGLWRWSRHPNYFFEWFGWLAYPVIGLSLDLSLGPRDAACTDLHVLDPGLCDRHSAAGGADAALPRRTLS